MRVKTHMAAYTALQHVSDCYNAASLIASVVSPDTWGSGQSGRPTDQGGAPCPTSSPASTKIH
jgi:hypothetical protein